jgi:Mg-chelatase subunit ChlD
VRIAVAFGIACAFFGPAVAEEDDDTGTARPVKVGVALEGEHQETMRIRLSLVLDVRRGMREHAIELPPRAVAIGATVRTREGTRPLVLTDAAVAGEKVDLLAEAPEEASMARAVLVAAPEIGPATITTLYPRRATLAVDLELVTPTCFDGDRRHVPVPETWAAVLEGGARRHLIDGDDERAAAVTARCGEHEATVWLALPATALARRPPGDARIGATGARFAHGAEQAARVEIAVASTLSQIPADLATVFVVDGSRSVAPDLADTQRAVIASYLRRAPGSRVQVVAFDRATHDLLPAWTRADTAAPRVDRALARLAARNGSDLDRGLARAAHWLARTAGTRRVVVFTDELLPHRLAVIDPARLAAVLPAGTLVHVVALDPGGDVPIARDDDALLAPLADATLGMAVRAALADDLDALALVRPTAVDHLQLIAPSFTPLEETGATCTGDDPMDPIALREGQACTWWGTGPSTVDSFTVEGRIWGRRWRDVITLGDRASLAAARELPFVLPRDHAPALVDAADAAAHAANAKWSLLAVWGGPGGYVAESELLGSWSGCGCMGPSDTLGGFGYAGIRVEHPPVADQIRDAIAACRTGAAAGAGVAIALETTREEIVGVAVTISGVDATTAAATRACVEAAAWDVPLAIVSPAEHATHQLTY